MSGSGQPLVSVIVPTHNRADLVGEALQSILAQTFRDFEIVVVDDGSTDGTEKVVAALPDPRIRYHWQENSGLPSNSRNVGIRLARGRFVAFLDSDDLWMPRKLEDQLAAMTAHPELVLVYSMIRNFGQVELKYDLYPMPWRAGLSREDLEQGKTIPCLTVLTRRDLLEDLGGFDEDPAIMALEDYDLWLRLSDRGPIGFIPRVHALYRIHATALSRDAQVMNQRLAYLCEKRKLKSTHSIRPYPNSSWRWRLVRAVAHRAVLGWIRLEECLARSGMKGIPLYRSGCPCSFRGPVPS